MSNHLPWEKRAAIKRLLASGVSLRRIAATVGCANNTAMRYSRMWTFDVKCACGRPAGHKAWCRVRLEFSPNRRGWLADHWNKRAGGDLALSVDRATREAMALGHKLGPFVWCSSATTTLAYALCSVCGKSAKLNSGERRGVIEGTALRERCYTAAELAAKRAAAQEIREWRKASRTVRAIKNYLRPPSSRTAASVPARTSHE